MVILHGVAWCCDIGPPSKTTEMTPSLYHHLALRYTDITTVDSYVSWFSILNVGREDGMMVYSAPLCASGHSSPCARYLLALSK